MKKLKIGSSASLLMLAALAFYQSHVIASVAIGVSDYIEISPNLYADPLFTLDEQILISSTVNKARARAASQYGSIVSDPILIVSSTIEKSARFFSGRITPGTTYNFPWGQYIPITPAGNNIDVMAHELVHAEVFHRLGFTKSLRSLPMWFIEGTAMQVDYRQGKAWTYIQEGRELPAIDSLSTVDKFMSGDRALHYAAAKIEVSSWLSLTPGLNLYDVLAEIRTGRKFEELYDLATEL